MTTTATQPTEAAAPAIPPLTPAQAEILTADAIAHAEALANALHAIGETAAANNVRDTTRFACDRAMKAAANNARPKGPSVTVARYSHGDEVLSTSTVEVLRRTATQVVTLTSTAERHASTSSTAWTCRPTSASLTRGSASLRATSPPSRPCPSAPTP